MNLLIDMKKVYEYSHLGGSEILHQRYPELEKEIDRIINSIKITKKTKVSKEKTMKGKLLYSPKLINELFMKGFRKKQWKELRLSHDIEINDRYTIKLKAFKQIDFSKNDVLVEVQLGKYAFMFYDMAKFQYFYNEKKAEVGIEIVPTWALHRQMSTGVSYGEQLIYDLGRLRRTFPAVPIKIILIDI